MDKGGSIGKIGREKVSQLSKEQQKDLATEITEQISKVNEMDFYELSGGNKTKAKSLMNKAYNEAYKNAYSKFGIEYKK
jgi:hypothetical protein